MFQSRGGYRWKLVLGPQKKEFLIQNLKLSWTGLIAKVEVMILHYYKFSSSVT